MHTIIVRPGERAPLLINVLHQLGFKVVSLPMGGSTNYDFLPAVHRIDAFAEHMALSASRCDRETCFSRVV
jgi:uroporphyrinogen-III synthase